MKILIAEDDFASRKFLAKFLWRYGSCDSTVDGLEAIEAFQLALEEGCQYDLICLDIMMPKVDGLKALKLIRDMEVEQNIPDDKRTKIIMTTVLNDPQNIINAFKAGCEAYITKPIDTNKLEEVMEKLGFK